ncbi:MAG: deoxyribonuclease IV [Candidatus Omnitrophota bacterium]|nr:deoxyribonuclease IV [Candidatus Omnitrophota bacterium]
MLILGCQVSSAGKIYEAVARAKKLGCNTMQIFVRNPRQWRKSSLGPEDIALFKERVAQEHINPVIAHIPYTLNLASIKQSFHKVTIREFIQDLLEAHKLGIQFLVTHPGSHKGGTEEEGLEKISQGLKKILKETKKNASTQILLENTAGSGRWLGYKFSQLRVIFEALKWSERLGLCLDTAHAWAAGYKIDEREGVEALVAEIDREVGLDRLKVIHVNDTKDKLDSRRDRHADIGAGQIGKKGFYYIVNHAKLSHVAFILETPKDSDEDDIRNLGVIRKLYSGG